MSDMPRVIHKKFPRKMTSHWSDLSGAHKQSYTREDLVDEKDKRITALEDALREAFHLLDDLAKLEVGDGSDMYTCDMYTCTMSADEYLERANGLHEKATALLGDDV